MRANLVAKVKKFIREPGDIPGIEVISDRQERCQRWIKTKVWKYREVTIVTNEDGSKRLDVSI
jgi:hypothetical protein